MAFLSYLLIIAFLCNSHNQTTATRVGLLLNSPKNLSSPKEKSKGLTPLPKPKLPPLPPIPASTPPVAPPTSPKSPSFEPSLTPSLAPKLPPKSFVPKPSKSPAPKAFLPPQELAPTASSISPSTAPEAFFEPVQSPLGQPEPKTVKPPKRHLPVLPKFPKLKCPPFFPWIPKTSLTPSSHSK